MLDANYHSVTPHHRAMLRQVRAGEVVVLFQSHCGVKATSRGVHHEKVPEDEMLVGKLLPTNSHSWICLWQHTAKMWPRWRTASTTSHLGQDELCSSYGGNLVSSTLLFSLSDSGILFREALLIPSHRFDVKVFPQRDVITNLHAYFFLGCCVSQCFVAGGCELAANDHIERESLVCRHAVRIHIPSGVHTHVAEVCLHYHEVMLASIRVGPTCRDDGKVKFACGHQEFALLLRENVGKEFFIGTRLDVALHLSQKAIEAIERCQVSSKDCFHAILELTSDVAVIAKLSLGAYPAHVSAACPSIFDSLTPVVREPKDAFHIHQHVDRPTFDWKAFGVWSPQSILRRRQVFGLSTIARHQQLPCRAGLQATFR
mmetsp:Transcript_11209/g.19673  ORF Transcript_11209/g.19673 Transcript_11209/m.19673 type:complete len:372 (-) Transcript_11209:31-1146(-)